MTNRLRASLKRYVFFVMFLATALVPIPADAANLNVWCSGSTPPDPLPPDHYLTLTEALNALAPTPVGPHFIFVNGACHNESVQIIGFTQLNILINPATTAVISHDQPAACGQPAATPFENQPVLRIVDSHQINLRANTANGSVLILRGGQGVSIDDSSVIMQGVTVENSRGGGVSLSNASNLTLAGRINMAPTPNLIHNHCASAISVGFGSTLNVNQGNTIQNNQGGGIGVGGSINLNATSDSSGQIVIQGNQGPGINLFIGASTASLGGQVIVQNNSLNTGAFPFRGGIVVTSGLLMINAGGVQIAGNNGPGIWADMQGKLRLGPPLNGTSSDFTISGNVDEGVRALHMSVVWSNSGVISGNGTADLTCDSSSLVFGNVTGIAVNKCASTEQSKKNN